MFLQTLKTLMAKLKASDWGALDRKLDFSHIGGTTLILVESENLAAYRAQGLQALLFNALVFGVTENDVSDDQLKVKKINEDSVGYRTLNPLSVHRRTWTLTKSLHMRIPMLSSGSLLETRLILTPGVTPC